MSGSVAAQEAELPAPLVSQLELRCKAEFVAALQATTQTAGPASITRNIGEEPKKPGGGGVPGGPPPIPAPEPAEPAYYTCAPIILATDQLLVCDNTDFHCTINAAGAMELRITVAY